MKRMSSMQIDREAKDVRNLWICKYGELNAGKLSLAVRRLFRTPKPKTKK